MTKIAAAALAGAFLFATTASALQTQATSGIRRGATIERQQELDNKRALRERIRATHEEYRALRNANDPRAPQVEQQLQSLKAEWQRLYGNSGQREGHKQMKKKRQKHNR